MASVYESLMQNIPAIFYRQSYDENWTTHVINNAIHDLIGYPASDFIQNKVRTFTSIIHPDDINYVEIAIDRAVTQKIPWELEYRVITKSGLVKWVSETGVGIFSSTNELLYLDGFMIDVSERKKIQLALKISERQILDMAYTDSITGLANRHQFTDRLDKLILSSKRYQTDFALIFIDLDQFKNVNDTHGHLLGDKLLSLAAKRISSTFRESDIVARFGGDEFLVVVKRTGDVENIQQITSKLLIKLATPYYIDDLELVITASIGIAISPKDGTHSNILIKNADKAMYDAKLAGKNQYSIFSEHYQEDSPGKQKPTTLDALRQ